MAALEQELQVALDLAHRCGPIALQIQAGGRESLATENKPDSPVYRIRDLSRGGMGLDVECAVLPPHLAIGAPAMVQMKLTTGQLAAHGEIIWIVQPDKEKSMPARVGVHFGRLAPATATMLDDLLTLKALPQPPWIARLAFGNDAMALMK